jgi:radical SAM superfamily enzyme YgiQ (UPF0313 family)
LNIKKILLIAPNFIIRDEYGDPADPPIGILYIAAVLESKKYEVAIIDANIENLSDNEILSRIVLFSPDIVGISCNYSPLHNPTIHLAQLIKKKLNKNIIVVAGGNHATASDEYLLKSSEGNIDFICKGEGETSFPELINGLESNRTPEEIKGISFYNKAEIISNTSLQIIDDLDSLPIPAYHLVPIGKYKRYNIISSRGCPYACTYCASKVIAKKMRYRNPKKVVDEIEFLLDKYGQKHFWFSDDTFTANFRHTEELMDELIVRQLNISWSCLTRVNVTREQLLMKMKRAGCMYISYGVESGDPGIIKKMDKRITLENVRNALHITKEVGLRMYCFFLVGYPGETKETIEKSYKLIKDTRPDGVSFAIVIPLPGTRLFHELHNKGLISYEELQWDYLFAKVPGNYKYEKYAATLASRWCNLTPQELIDACIKGENLLKDETIANPSCTN